MNDSTLISFIVVAVISGTPLVFVSVGELLAQRSGVMNLGLEGTMLIGAVTAFGATVATENVWIGLLAGAASGVGMAMLHAVVSISLRADQVVSGIALTIIGSALSVLIGSAGDQPLTTRAPGGSFEPVFSGGLADLPIVGPIIFGYDALVYLSWLFVAATSYYLGHTRAGLWVRAVGQDPASADTAGISVARTRYVHVLIGGAAAGVGGAYLTLALFDSWKGNLSAGQGWIAFAIIIFCRWRPFAALLVAYVFGALTSIGFKLQLIQVPIPSDVLTILPFIAAMVMLLLVSTKRFRRSRSEEPTALAQPYWRESR